MTNQETSVLVRTNHVRYWDKVSRSWYEPKFSESRGSIVSCGQYVITLSIDGRHIDFGYDDIKGPGGIK